MDAQEQLVYEGEISAAVLGKGEEFILIRIADGEPIDETLTQQANARGFSYCGVFAVKDGVAAARCEPDFASTLTCVHASFAFAQMAADHLRRPQKDDFVAFAEGLTRLPDPRSTN